MELVKRRTLCSKTFDLGNGQRRLVQNLGGVPMHYMRDGKLEDIDLACRDANDAFIVDKAPYALRVSADSLAYLYQSNSGTVSAELVAIGGARIPTPLSPTRSGNVYVWEGVATETDYYITPINAGVSTELVLKGGRAPKSWTWEIIGDSNLLRPIVGKDANGQACEITTSVSGNLVTATWTGRVTHRRLLRTNPEAPWGEVAWPVRIDPTVNEAIGLGTDDVWEYTTGGLNTASTTVFAGYGTTPNTYMYSGFRFQTIAVPAAATITVANLTTNVVSVDGGSPNLIWYASFAGDVATWGGAGNRPRDDGPNTSAVAESSWSVGPHITDVKLLVQEIVNRGDWVSGNNMRFVVTGSSSISASEYVGFEALEAAGTGHATLDITYTEATFGTLLGASTTIGASSGSITNPFTVTTTLIVEVGDLVVVVLAQQTDLTVTGITDNLSNTYTDQNAGSDGVNVTGRMFYSRVTTAGTITSISAATTASANNVAMVAAAFRGPFVVSPIDANPANDTTDLTSPFTCPATGTLSQPRELVVAWACTNDAVAKVATSPNLLAVSHSQTNQPTAAIGYQVVSSTASVAPAFTGTNPTSIVLGTASFKAAGGRSIGIIVG